MWNLFVLFSWRSFHFGMHMTCPSQCQLDASPRTQRDGCEDSDALYRFVTRKSPSTCGRRYLRGSRWKLLSCPPPPKKQKQEDKRTGWVIKKRSTDVELSLRVCLGTVVSSLIICVTSPLLSVRKRRRKDSQPAENTCRHANTTWEGANRKFGFMWQIHKCQVMNTHTAMDSSL